MTRWLSTLIIALLSHAHASASPDASSPNELVSQLSPSISSAWLKILHMEPKGPARWQSRVESSAFFFAADGASHPQAEWDAALAKFSAPYQGPPDQNPQCQFPARAELMRRRGGFDWPKPDCPALNAFKSGIGAQAVTVVHAAQYMEDPASVFGHIFLRFDVTTPESRTLRLDTLAYSAGYFAIMPPDVNSFDYIFKGLTGGFSGHFVIDTYARSLFSYNRMENRELKEYKLALSAEQIDRLLNHLWELRHYATFSYRFLRENCAFQTLALLDTVVDHTDLTSSFHIYTVPSDAIRILEESGMIRSYAHRRSLGEELRTRLDLLDANDREQTRRLVEGRDAPEQVRNPKVLEATYDVLEYRTHQRLGKVPSDWRDLQKALLVRRAQLPAHDGSTLQEHHTEPPPIHGPARAGLGLFRNSAAVEGLLVDLRPAMQNNLELNALGSGLALELLDIRLGVLRSNYDSSKPFAASKVFIDRFTVFEVENLRGFDTLDYGLAWQLKLGWESMWTRPESSRLSVVVKPGVGVASAPTRPLQGYVMAKLPLMSPPSEPERSRMHIGVATGARWQIASRWLGRFEVASLQPISGGALGDRFITREVDMNLILTSSVSISVSHATYPSAKWELMAYLYF